MSDYNDRNPNNDRFNDRSNDRYSRSQRYGNYQSGQSDFQRSNEGTGGIYQTRNDDPYNSERDYYDERFEYDNSSRRPGSSRQARGDFSAYRSQQPDNNWDYGMSQGSARYGRSDRYGSDQASNWRDYSYDQDYDSRQDHSNATGSKYGSGYGSSRRQTGPYWSYSEIWLIPGPHTGTGPEGYKRSKETIREEANERLTRHGQLEASQIRVDVDDKGEITLSGEVENRQAKRMAEEAVESISGVRDVHNRLTLKSKDTKNESQKQASRSKGSDN